MAQMKLLRKIRATTVLRRVLHAEALAARLGSESSVAAWQLDRLNEVWTRIVQNVPWYRDQWSRRNLPERFESLDEFASTVPITTRAQLRNRLDQRIDPTRPPEAFRATGGSTAEPLRFPCWTSEAQTAATAAWQARSWLGISPADRLFLLWGHSHLFGTGWRGSVRRAERRFRDLLLGYCRWSAYDLEPSSLRRAAQRLCEFRPDYVVGYSAALDRFAEANLGASDRLRTLNLKAVIATAEAFPSADSRDRIRDLFGCPVLMEYGAVETGVLAHEITESCYRTLWQNYLLECDRSGADGRADLLVTSLFPRCLPLVRYRIGDQIEATDDCRTLLWFRRVLGRCNDAITLGTGRVIHSEAIAHIVRDFPQIMAYQLAQFADGRVELRLRTAEEPSPQLQSAIRNRLRLLDAALGETELRRVAKLEQSVAGKTPTVLHLGHPRGELTTR